MADSETELRDLVSDVAAAYFSNSHVAIGDIQKVIDEIAAGLTRIGTGSATQAEPSPEPVVEEAPEAAPDKKLTAAQIRKSITPDALVSFEDGKRYKALRRHLSIRGLTPEQYREKWGLPRDYPMVSPAYSAQRSEMAKSIGLGQKGRGARQVQVAPAPAKRGRKKAVAG